MNGKKERSGLQRIVSGGQTGVDRGALDAAMALGIPVGGWVPAGRLAEDGRVPDRYPLNASPSDNYSQRTEWNVRDSDGTLIITSGEPEGGTAYTVAMTRKHQRPCFVLDMNGTWTRENFSNWLADNEIRILNVAGPRESKQPGIRNAAYQLILHLLGG